MASIPSPKPANTSDAPNSRRSKLELEVLQCAGPAEWDAWLAANHARSPGVWLKIAKRGSSTSTVSYLQALEVALTHGWIDGQKRAFDGSFWLQRFTVRGSRSKWSQVNRQAATELIESGRMREAGLAQVSAARADGRWDSASEPQSRATVPDDLRQALEQNPAAHEFFQTLTGARRYAFLYRLQNVKTGPRRAQRIAEYVAILSERRTLN